MTRTYHVPSNALWGIIGIFALLLVYPFMDTLGDMVHRWNTKEEYGYGYMIPMITLFLVWQRRDALMDGPFQPTLLAAPLLLITGVIYFMGAVATTHTLSQYAFVMTILSFAYGILGWQKFRIIAIPLALLFLMIPLPPFIYNNLSGKLQLISSELGVAVIRLFDISVFLEGNVIDLGKFQLQVVEACAGLRYLFPLISLSFVAAYLYNVETWKRVVVFLSSVPITVFMNSFRIGMIGVLVEYYGIEQAEGFLHDFEGWIIFMACMALLFLEMAILARIGPNKKQLHEVFALEFPEELDDDAPRKPQHVGMVHYVLIGVVTLYSISTLYIVNREQVQLERKDFVLWPSVVGEWSGRKQTLDRLILDSLKTDDYVIADYVNSKGKAVNFYIAYYASQQAGSAAHSPRACIPGGGWQIDRLETINVDTDGKGFPGDINRLYIRKGDIGQLVYYWFQQRGRVISNEYMVKWYLFLDSLTRNRTDGALVRLTTIVQPGEDMAVAEKRLKAMLSEVDGMLPEYIPD